MPILDRSRKERSIQGRFVTEVYDKTRREMCKGSCLGDDSPTSGVEFKREN